MSEKDLTASTKANTVQQTKQTEEEFILYDRITKIKQVINKYGEDNFYLSFSGGKDSTVLSVLLDMAVPENKIPRVYANTGIELNMIRDFVLDVQDEDDRVVIIKPSVPIKQMLEKEGYPFKSKDHSEKLMIYQRSGMLRGIQKYVNKQKGESFRCPEKLKYQFSDDFKLKISDMCCKKMKEEPLKIWQKKNNKPYAILGTMQSEGGRRRAAVCLAWKGKDSFNFQPLVHITKEWEEWFIDKYNVNICDIYKEPYNFNRTGCKGCPFIPWLQKDLDILEKFFPNERKQCEIIWKPVYDEYRRLGYRLKDREPENANIEGQMNIYDYMQRKPAWIPAERELK